MVVAHHAHPVHQEHHGYGIDGVPVVQVASLSGLDLLERHRLALQRSGDLDHRPACIACRRCEHGDQPGSVGAVEVAAVQLLGYRPARTDRGIGTPTLHQVGQGARGGGHQNEEQESVHGWTRQSVLAGSLTAA